MRAREIVVQALERKPGLRERCDDGAGHQDDDDNGAVPERQVRPDREGHES